MRIISGWARGRKLATPPAKSNDIRPTSDRAREALFSILGPAAVQDSCVLDLFAGTGALGLEALSRGAEKITLVDISQTSLKIISKNLLSLQDNIKKGSVSVLRHDLRKGLPHALTSGQHQEQFDLIFLDPPYSMGLSLKILEWLSNSTLLRKGCIVVAEERASERLPDVCGRLHLTDQRNYGDTGFWLYSLQSPQLDNAQGADMCISSPERPTIAIYPGTFDPITYGHIDIIKRGLNMFDKVIVTVAKNPSKSPLFSLEERMAMITESFASEGQRIEVDSVPGLLVEYAATRRATAIIRGLRAVSDFDYEFQLALMNRKLERSVDTIFLMPGLRWIFISSTIIKDAARHGGNVNDMVPRHVEQMLKEKFPR